MGMFRTILLACVVVSAAFLSAQSTPTEMSSSERVLLMSRIYADVRMYFAHWSAIPDFDLDTEYASYVKEALAAPDRKGFDLATLRFFAKLRNGHTDFHDGTLWKSERGLGFSLREVDGALVVDKSLLATLPRGSVIRKIDGEEVETFLTEKLVFVPAYSRSEAVRTLASMPYLFPARFSVVLEDGRSAIVDRAQQKLDPVPARNMQGVWIQPGLALIRIPSFEAQFEEDARNLLKTFSTAKTLILDVRDNSGGTSPTRLLDDLIGQPWRDFSSTTPMHIASDEATAHLPFSTAEGDAYQKGYLSAFEDDEYKEMRIPARYSKTPKGSVVFHGRLIVLSGIGCASACEDLLAAIQDSKRGQIIGENSYGSSGQPYYDDFGDGFNFRISARREYLADGAEFEGVGVVPDIAVAPTLEDLRLGRDPVMQRALEEASK